MTEIDDNLAQSVCAASCSALLIERLAVRAGQLLLLLLLASTLDTTGPISTCQRNTTHALTAATYAIVTR